MTEENLREQVDDSVPEDIELFKRGDEIHGRDEHGEFQIKPMAGTETPQEGRCGVPLKFYETRYGQIRYCGGLPVGRFNQTQYDNQDFCKHHQSRKAIMERAYEMFEHGYFATNYINFAKSLSAPKFLFAVEMVGGLFELSKHEFDPAIETREIDSSDSDIIEEDSVSVDLPIPTNETVSVQANELWTAALKQVMTQNMQEAVFKDGMSKKTLTASSDMEGQITDTHYEMTEHHLHLPLSRVAKDIKNHLENGGVLLDDDDSGVVTFQKNDYTLDVRPQKNDSDDAENLSEVSEDFTEQLKSEDNDESATIEIAKP